MKPDATESQSGLTGVINQLKEIRESGGAWCIICGKVFDTIKEARQHDLAEHYDYVLAQCKGNKELLRK